MISAHLTLDWFVHFSGPLHGRRGPHSQFQSVEPVQCEGTMDQKVYKLPLVIARSEAANLETGGQGR